MRTEVFAILAGLIVCAAPAAAPAHAGLSYKPTEWQAASVERLPKLFGKIKEAYWSQSISLWLAVDRDGTDWQSASGMICAALTGAGKPHDAFVAISYLDRRAFPQRVEIAKAYCEPTASPPAPSDAPPVDMGVMGADGVIRPE